jgi:hypothetical protein
MSNSDTSALEREINKLVYRIYNLTKEEKEQLTKEILSGKITDNIRGLKRALSLRCLPKVFTETVKDLEKKKKVERVGCKGYKSTDT